MISDEQMRRAEREFATAALAALGPARGAECALDLYQYSGGPEWSLDHCTKLRTAYAEADYIAESRAWIHQLIAAALKVPSKAGASIPASAVCYFKDGDQWCCVHADFVNLQESPAGFGDTMDAALAALVREDESESAKARAALLGATTP